LTIKAPIQAGCWAHARRKLFELADIAAKARKGKPSAISPIAFEAVQKFDAIFALERIDPSRCQAAPKRRKLRGQVRSAGFSAAEKTAVTSACQNLIDDFLKPRFLRTIRPTQFNYPIDILGKWHGTKYRFIQRYRSGFQVSPYASPV
jgi:hypothetical protein